MGGVPQVMQSTEPCGWLFLLLFVLWWFIRREPDEPAAEDEDGGQLVEPASSQHPHRPRPGGGRRPRSPRRGPHGTPGPAAPSRVRTGPSKRSRVIRDHH